MLQKKTRGRRPHKWIAITIQITSRFSSMLKNQGYTWSRKSDPFLPLLPLLWCSQLARRYPLLRLLSAIVERYIDI